MQYTLLRTSVILLLLYCSSCGYYTRDIMFRASKEKEKEFLEKGRSAKVANNYLISKGDYIDFQIFTNKGEILVDPTSEFSKAISGGSTGGASRMKYLVQSNGQVTLPILGGVKIDSLTNHQCDSVLIKLYSQYYLEPYIITKVLNRRVFVLSTGGVVGGGGGQTAGGGGASGGGVKAVILDNENISLFDLLAQVGGPALYSHVERVKVIRGDLKNPQIMTFDLRHWDSYQKSELTILPNDIVYIVPGRRPVFDFARDVAAVTSFLSTILALLVLFKVY